MAIFGDIFASCVFSEPHAEGFKPALKFALRPHHVWKYMADSQSATAEIRRGKKEQTTA